MNKITNFTIFTILLVSSLTIMVGTVIAPSLSGIVKHTNFNLSPSWLITLPSLGVVVFAPLIGRLINTLGNFKVLCLGLVPYGVLGVMGAFITNDYILILDRFLLGGATVAVQVAVTGFIAALFTGEKRMKMIAWQVMSIEFGGVLFLAIGGILGQMHWQYPFYIYLTALVCLVLVVKTLPKATPKKEDKNVLIKTSAASKFKVKIIFCASLLAMMLFFIGFVTLPLYLPESFGFTESKTGFLMAFISLITIIVASQMPKMVKILGDGKTVALGFLFFMFGYLVLATTSSIVFLVLAAIFIGIGFGFTIPLLSHMMIEVSNEQNQGKNLSLLSMGIFGGQFLSTFIQYVSDNYQAVYGVSAVFAVVISVVVYYMFQQLSKTKFE
ncbi:MFS transporter [Lacinutrix sp. C3R15]|uniref:MFS transporter n=1 Tax=Flavobacteriaceae TaxID=49546 RepID=UPI001C092B9E|nr:MULTISPECIES: MFS transporter [Flavobacteriaceae]MBU2938784.1 MFS transporter [Lacinutrix sp. C3R15]MDO6622097.1 MFS transporter [Oceanihabitans sp. 1_MG-2023]